jgi:hypothetical protein
VRGGKREGMTDPEIGRDPDDGSASQHESREEQHGHCQATVLDHESSSKERESERDGVGDLRRRDRAVNRDREMRSKKN